MHPRIAMASIVLATPLCIAACGDAPPPPPNVTPPPALQIDDATRSLSKDPKFAAFKAEVRELRTLSAEYASLRKATAGGGTPAERSRMEELDGLIAGKVTALNEAMSAAGVGEADAKAMRYLFAATDEELAR